MKIYHCKFTVKLGYMTEFARNAMFELEKPKVTINNCLLQTQCKLKLVQ